LSFITLVMIEAALVAFFGIGYVLWRRSRSPKDAAAATRRSRRVVDIVILVMATAAIAAACDRDTPPPAANDSGAAVLADDDAAFAIIHGEDTVAVERFRRTEQRLDGELTDRNSGARLVYGADLGAAARIRRLDVALYAPGDPQPQVRASVSFAGDTLVIEQEINGEASSDRTELPPGTTLYLNPSIAMIELLLERGLADETFPLLSLSADAGPRLVEPTVVRQNGTARFIVPGETDVALRVEQVSRIVSGESVGGVPRFERIR
jgi:hypothetical protein